MFKDHLWCHNFWKWFGDATFAFSMLLRQNVGQVRFCILINTNVGDKKHSKFQKSGTKNTILSSTTTIEVEFKINAATCMTTTEDGLCCWNVVAKVSVPSLCTSGMMARTEMSWESSNLIITIVHDINILYVQWNK